MEPIGDAAMTNVRVTKGDPPETKEILAEAIVRIGDSINFLNSNGLNKRAIVVLLQDYTRLPKKQIEAVLDAPPKLRGWYCR
jgi:hypothetical protein